MNSNRKMRIAEILGKSSGRIPGGGFRDLQREKIEKSPIFKLHLPASIRSPTQSRFGWNDWPFSALRGRSRYLRSCRRPRPGRILRGRLRHRVQALPWFFRQSGFLLCKLGECTWCINFWVKIWFPSHRFRPIGGFLKIFGLRNSGIESLMPES